MDRKEALRVLNLIGVTSQSETELRYFELMANIEILIGAAGTAELKQMYRESSQSVQEAYELLRHSKQSKLLDMESVVEGNGPEAEMVFGETGEALSQLRSSLSEVNQIRTYLQKYSALLEVQLAKAEEVIKKVETQNKTLEDTTCVIQELRTSAECNVNEIALHLENAKQLAFEMQKRKSESAKMTTASTGKGKFLNAIIGRPHLTQPP